MKQEHNTNHTTDTHGSIKSYAIGYVLSILFTIIPYYLVVEKVISGRSLLFTILGIAVIQMAIQIFFFLHLGRGPKPLYNIFFFMGTVGIIAVVVFGSIFIMDNLHYNMAPEDVTKNLAQKEAIGQIGGVTTGACQDIGENHKVTIKNGVVTPKHTKAKLCDTLTFITNDDVRRKIGFGPHPRHDSYGGQTEVPLRSGYPKTITLNEPGSQIFHDHYDADVNGTFTVLE